MKKPPALPVLLLTLVILATTLSACAGDATSKSDVSGSEQSSESKSIESQTGSSKEESSAFFDDNDYEKYIDVKFERTPTIDEDFKDDRVIVTLKHKYSNLDIETDLYKFETEKIVVADSLSSVNSKNATVSTEKSEFDTRNQIKFETIEDIMPLKTNGEYNSLINKDVYHQILSIKIYPTGKEKVLEAISELKKWIWF
ncbi:MAG: hypothetical protein FWG69_03775 [Oscillospiraceae bacterium]|nr:hypothetical protein [Oscillospiraceae bacterium]